MWGLHGKQDWPNMVARCCLESIKPWLHSSKSHFCNFAGFISVVRNHNLAWLGTEEILCVSWPPWLQCVQGSWGGEKNQIFRVPLPRNRSRPPPTKKNTHTHTPSRVSDRHCDSQCIEFVPAPKNTRSENFGVCVGLRAMEVRVCVSAHRPRRWPCCLIVTMAKHQVCRFLERRNVLAPDSPTWICVVHMW